MAKGESKPSRNAGPASEATGQAATPREMLGSILLLLLSSPAHRHQFISDLEWQVMPPVMFRQFRVYMKDQMPTAYVSWALLSEEVEQRLISGQRRLKPEEWKGGENAWLIDLVAPQGGAEGVLRELKNTVFANQPLWTVRPAPDGKGMQKVEIQLGPPPAAAPQG